jgi:hypothetical protein
MKLDSKNSNSPNAVSSFKKAATYFLLVVLGAGVTFSGSYLAARNTQNVGTFWGK